MSAWEAFRDPSYFDMWCVRKVGERRFRRVFHLVNGDEAIALAEMLSASVDTLPKGQDAKQGLAGTESGAVPEGQTPNPHHTSGEHNHG